MVKLLIEIQEEIPATRITLVRVEAAGLSAFQGFWFVSVETTPHYHQDHVLGGRFAKHSSKASSIN